VGADGRHTVNNLQNDIQLHIPISL